MPVAVQYERAIRFRTWDRFQLPLPFSKVRMILGETMPIPRRMNEEDFEAKRLEIEQIMQAGALTFDGAPA